MLKKIFKWFFIIICSLILLIFISLISFKLVFSQRKITAFELNAPSIKNHILIASQGSKFKNKLNEILLDEFKTKNVYIKVIDVSLLKNINPSDWKSIIIINTIEARKMEKNVAKFIKENYSSNNIILIITSGSGNFKLKDFDAISTASNMKNIENIKKQIINKINNLL